MTATHAEYAPSSMYLTVACPGWHKQAAPLPPQPETEQSREGDAGHWVAAQYAGGGGGIVPRAGAIAPNGVEISDDMLDGAAVWVDALEGYPARIETPVQIRSVHPTKCWGTPDARQWNSERKLHRTADYKFGYAYVDEFENWQLLAYTVGSLDEVYSTWRDDPAVTAEMTVAQPRYYRAAPVRTWKIQTAGLLHYEARMRAAVREAESENPRVISGTHCTYCPARAHCNTFAKTVMHAVDFAGRPDPMVSTPEQVGRELRLVQEFIKRLEARETGLVALAEAHLRAGGRVPFYSLERTEGRLKWIVPPEVVEMTAKLSGKSAYKPPELITPTQARDRKILADTVVNEYAARPVSLSLTLDTNKTARKFTI